MSEGKMPFDIRGKTVLITGAGRGIGRGIARVFARSGARVAVNALTETYVLPLVEELNRSGGEAAAFVADVTDSAVVDEMVREVTGRFGAVDVLINNLGDAIRRAIATPEGGGAEGPMSDDDWRFILDVNLTHAFYLCRAAGRQMLTRGQGKVITIGSSASRSGGAGMVAYTAAKSGTVGFTQALALEWAPYNVQVNAIAPGSFPDAEAMSRKARTRADERSKERVPLRRVGRPEEVGFLALYLASAESDYMTGQTLYLDGGLTLK